MTDFERYVAEYSRELTRFCIKLCGDVHDAEDLFQDTWARALDKFDQYDQSSSFKSWLFTICANLFRNSKKLKYKSSKAGRRLSRLARGDPLFAEKAQAGSRLVLLPRVQPERDRPHVGYPRGHGQVAPEYREETA